MSEAPQAEVEEAVEVTSNKLTPEEELALLALEEAEAAAVAELEEEDEEEGDDFDDSVFTVAAPAAGPGQIRFAEDIMEDFRGPGRRGRRRRSGGVARTRRRPAAKSRSAPRPPVAGPGA